jgi:DNA-binding response OmpR family regulator
VRRPPAVPFEPMRPRNHGRRVILIVDDDDYVHGAVRAVLRRTQATVVRASTAAEGRAVARDTGADLAIVDVGLPDGDGYTLARLLKADAAPDDLRVIILTGHAPDESAASASHVDAIIAKPFRLHEFLATVERMLVPPAAPPTSPTGATGASRPTGS